MHQQQNAPLSLFYSYADEDETLHKRLEIHLTSLNRENILSDWHKRKISVGMDSGKEIDMHLETASIILLLISPDFLACDYNYNNEMQKALERHKQGFARVIPIILKPCDWRAFFGHLQCTPRNGKAVTEWENQDTAFFSITQDIRQAIKDLNTQHPLPQEPSTSPPSLPSLLPKTTIPLSPLNTRPQVSHRLSRRDFVCAGLGGAVGVLGTITVSALLKHEQLTSVQVKPKQLTSVQVIMAPSSFSSTYSEGVLAYLRDALHNALRLPVSVMSGDTYLDSLNRFTNRECNVFWASDYIYVKATAHDHVVPILRRESQTSDEPYYYSYILTKAESKISKLADLRGRSLSYVDRYSTSGYLLPRYGMHQIGLEEKDLQSTYYMQSHANSLESIFNGQADACAVSSEWYKSKDGVKSPEYTDLLQKYQVNDESIIPLFKSDPLFMPPIAVHSDVSPDDQQLLQKGFLNLQDPTMLGELGIAGFDGIVDKDYDFIRKVAQNLGIGL